MGSSCSVILFSLQKLNQSIYKNLMREKHAPTEVLSFSKNRNRKTLTLHCYCGDNDKLL